MAFLVWYFGMTEHGRGTSGGATQLIFKRGAKIPEVNESSRDEEKGTSASSFVRDAEFARGSQKVDNENTKHALIQRGVFSWHHLNYDIVLRGGETRRLLDDVSGYVAPGKLVCMMFH
jgi:hypothetical protein